MLRKLAAAIAIAGSVGGTFGTGAAYGLGLGDIRLNSALNQPLSAEIELVQSRDLTVGEMLPSMATREDFQRAGVERPYFLSDLRFETIARDNGTVFVRVTSRKPVVEPYLNFLVEVHWPSGRLLREYTLLLDPPSFSNEVVKNVAEIPAPVIAAKPEPVKQTPAPRGPEVVAPVTAVAIAEGGARTYTVKKNDTLWEVALDTRPGRDVSPVKMMAALQTENPGAFINGNINLLKQGSVLNIPDRTMIESLDAAAANQNITRQNRQWQQGQVQVDATRKTEVAETARGTVEEDRLNIVTTVSKDVAGEGADQGDGQAGGGSTRELESAISLNQEQLDTLSRENSDLKNRLRELEGQISSLENLVVLKSDQLTAAQMLDQQVEDAKAQSAVSQATEEIDYNYYEADPVADQKEQEIAAAAPVIPAGGQGGASNKPVPTDGSPAPAASGPSSMLDQLMANPVYLGAAGGAGALLLALLALVAVRRRKDDESDDELMPEGVDEVGDLPEVESMFATESDAQSGGSRVDEDSDEKDADQELHVDRELLNTPEPVQPETADAIGEADIYIAYGRFDQAEVLLNTAIAREPTRADLRIKLLEVLAETGDAPAFLAQEQELQNLGSSEGMNRAGELRPRFPAGVFDIAPEQDVVTEASFDDVDTSELDDVPENEGLEFDLEDIEPAATSNVDSVANDFDLDFDALETELEAEVAGADLELPELQDLELDASLEYEQEDAVEQPEETVSEGVDDSAVDEGTEVVSASEATVDLDAELEQLDAELAGLSADLDLDGGAIEKALAPEAVAGEEPASVLTEQEPEKAAEPVSDGASTANAIDEALAGLSDSDAMGDIDQMEEEFSFLDDTDETATKLDLARAYMEMGDKDGARDILDEVVLEGSGSQQEEARGLIDKISN